MGLDMYLIKTKRVEDLTPDQYASIDEGIPWGDETKPDLTSCEDTKNLPGSKELNGAVELRGSGSFTYWSIFKEIAYWRKSNHIHGWFVKNIQEGIDECQFSEVTEKNLKDLLETCNQVLASKSEDIAEDLLPTTEGFFFGNKEYSEWYFQDIERTTMLIKEVLKSTNFEKEIVLYRASW